MALPFREAGSLSLAAAPLLHEIAKKNAIAETVAEMQRQNGADAASCY